MIKLIVNRKNILSGVQQYELFWNSEWKKFVCESCLIFENMYTCLVVHIRKEALSIHRNKLFFLKKKERERTAS